MQLINVVVATAAVTATNSNFKSSTLIIIAIVLVIVVTAIMSQCETCLAKYLTRHNKKTSSFQLLHLSQSSTLRKLFCWYSIGQNDVQFLGQTPNTEKSIFQLM